MYLGAKSSFGGALVKINEDPMVKSYHIARRWQKESATQETLVAQKGRVTFSAVSQQEISDGTKCYKSGQKQHG